MLEVALGEDAAVQLEHGAEAAEGGQDMVVDGVRRRAHESGGRLGEQPFERELPVELGVRMAAPEDGGEEIRDRAQPVHQRGGPAPRSRQRRERQRAGHDGTRPPERKHQQRLDAGGGELRPIARRLRRQVLDTREDDPLAVAEDALIQPRIEPVDDTAADPAVAGAGPLVRALKVVAGPALGHGDAVDLSERAHEGEGLLDPGVDGVRGDVDEPPGERGQQRLERVRAVDAGGRRGLGHRGPVAGRWIFSLTIRLRSVLGRRPRRSAACPRPSIVQPLRSSAATMWLRSASRSVVAGAAAAREARAGGTASASSSLSCGPVDRIRARSITFCSSRTLPGHA